MKSLLPRPGLAWAAAALYAAAVVVVLPLHALLEAPHAGMAPRGVIDREGPDPCAREAPGADALSCPGGPCRIPEHHHRTRPVHDDSTCPVCGAAARLLALKAPAPGPEPAIPVVARGPEAPAARVVVPALPSHPARGPPARA